jgi:hypothetical protein
MGGRDHVGAEPTLKRQGLYPCEAEIARRLSQSERQAKDRASTRARGIAEDRPADGRPVLAGGRSVLP